MILQGGALIKIGRAPDNDIVVNHPQVSRHHAVLERTGTTIKITDLGSTNGTMVNGQRVSAVALNPGDMIQLGTTTLTFRVDG